MATEVTPQGIKFRTPLGSVVFRTEQEIEDRVVNQLEYLAKLQELKNRNVLSLERYTEVYESAKKQLDINQIYLVEIRYLKNKKL